MRTRYGVAAAFVAIVAVLIFVRDEGYLGGRTDGGPLVIGAGGVGGGGPTGATEGFGLMPSLEGDPVEIQAVRPDFKSPGLDFRAARMPTSEGRCGICDYPRRGKLFVGSRYAGGGEAVVGLRAARPGAYYALDLITDYKRGIRRFRRYTEQSLCIQVGEDARCGQARTFDAPLAEIGGPSDYGVRVRDDGLDGLEAPIVATKPRSLLVPLVNLTPRTIEIADLRLMDSSGPLELNLTAKPADFGLRARAGRTVRLDLDPEGCLQEGTSMEATRLRARIDGDTVSVPLTVALQFAAPC